MSIRTRLEQETFTIRLSQIGVFAALILICSIVGWISGSFGAGALVGLLLGVGAVWLIEHVVTLMYQDKMPPPDTHLFIKHQKSGEWGTFYPDQHPQVFWPGHRYIVTTFEYEEHEANVESKLPFPRLTITTTFRWKPDRDHIDIWVMWGMNNFPMVRSLCVEAAEDAAERVLHEAVTQPGEPDVVPWSAPSIARLSSRASRWKKLLKRPLPFTPPDLSKTGIKTIGACSYVLTRIPEEPWEDYRIDDLHIGNDGDEAVFLDDDDQVAHIQIIGASRFGKSKLVEYAMRQLIYRSVEGVCVIDPNQQLYDDLLTWCVHRGYMNDMTHFLDPSDEESVIGFNPFRLEGKRTPDRISARANRLQATTLKALGTPGDAIQAQRIIKCLYYVLIEQDLPITDLNAFMVPRLFDRRDEIMATCQSQDIRDQWEMLTAGKGAAAYVNMMQSSANRLFDIIAERGVQRIFTNPRPLNLREITAEGHTLIVNLAKSDIFPIAARNVIGAFLVDEIWDIISSRTREQVRNLPDFHFAIDEFHNFATPEFATMLKEGGKYKLHLWLINHSLEDLDRTVRGSLNACHTRIAFGGTAQKDAATIMEGSRPDEENDLRDEISWIPGLDPREFMLRRTGKRNMFCTTPEVRDFPVKPESKDAYLEWQTRGLARSLFPGLTPGTPEFREAINKMNAENELTLMRLLKDATPEAVGESPAVIQNDSQEPAEPSEEPQEIDSDFYH